MQLKNCINDDGASQLLVFLSAHFWPSYLDHDLLNSSDNSYSALYESKYRLCVSLSHSDTYRIFFLVIIEKKQEPVIFLPTTLQNLSKSLLKVKNPFLVVQGRPDLKVKLKRLWQKRCRNQYCRNYLISILNIFNLILLFYFILFLILNTSVIKRKRFIHL